ncbi:MAG: 50S ribosomal protein L11 methyltransferase [Pseudomonadota bacterium]
MAQTRIYASTTEIEAKDLLLSIDEHFSEQALPISVYEKPDHSGGWEISVYCDEVEAEQLISTLASLSVTSKSRLSFAKEAVPNTDWVEATLKSLNPVRAGRFIVHGSHDKDVPAQHETPILVDAGLAFGTGHHGTTAGCLEMLDCELKRHHFYNALDLGSGSGVLAIAVAKRTKAYVLASDIDPIATQTAKANARQNGVQQKIECITSDGFSHRRFAEQAPFDLVIANILSKPLQQLAKDIAHHTMGNGLVILSGLLPHQRTAILATFRIQGLSHLRSHIRDGWLTLVLTKG